MSAEDRERVERLVRTAYPDALAAFAQEGGEVDLVRAYELGRAAIAAGASHLAIIDVHHRALTALLAGTADADERARVLARAGAFLSEALAPFEMALRGFSDALATVQRANATLERTITELRNALRVREDFLSIASHELKTPLTSAKLQIDAMLRRSTVHPSEAPAWVVDSAKAVQRQVQRLARLADELLDASAIAEGRIRLEPSDVDLAAVARSVTGELTEQLRLAGCALVLDADGPVRGRWDAGRLHQIAANLLSNAMKFGAGAPIEVKVGADGGRARLVVRDHGVGISPADQPRIFERFERFASVQSYGGFGLGLWVTRQIVEAMGGTIRVESAVGQGATFTVELPATR